MLKKLIYYPAKRVKTGKKINEKLVDFFKKYIYIKRRLV
jgi:hypothetical protein